MPKVKEYMVTRLDGKTVVITGANTGIGKETAMNLALRGALVIMGCRDVDKAQQAIDDLKSKGASSDLLVAYKLDLASFKSIREFAAEVLAKHEKIHILINNAGIMMCPEWKTEENFEMQFGVNHIGHFLLTDLLLERIKESAPSRIVIVSSVAHKGGKINFDDLNMEKKYHPMDAYSQSKLANILHAKELAKRLTETGVSVFSLHPGVIATELNRNIGIGYSRFIGWLYNWVAPYILKTPIEGAETTIFCATHDGLEILSGAYFSGCAAVDPSREAQNKETAKRLWEVSKSLVDSKN